MRAETLRGLKKVNLKSLLISHANLDAPTLEALSDLTTLTSLKFKDCIFEGAIIKNPRKLRLLENIGLCQTKIGPADFDAIDKLSNLYAIDLAKCEGVSPEFIRSFKNKSKLRIFCFGSEQIAREHIEALSELKQINRLELTQLETAMLNEAIKVASQLPKMHLLIITDCHVDSDTFLAITNTERLTYLKFDHVEPIARADLVKLGKLPKLTQLELDDVPLSSPRDLLAVLNIAKLDFLRTVNVREIPPDVIARLNSMVKTVVVEQ